MDNVGGNKLLYFLAGVAVGGIIVYSARSPQVRSLLAKAAGKGLKLGSVTTNGWFLTRNSV